MRNTTRRARTLGVVMALASAAVAGCGQVPNGGPRAVDPGTGGAALHAQAAAHHTTGGDVPRRPRVPLLPWARTQVHTQVLPSGQVSAPYTRPAQRPNVLMITVDDSAPGDMKFMPNVNRLIADEGVKFAHSIAPTPICVPARASLLTGQYAHNHGAYTIEGAGGGFASFHGDDNTLPVWLQAAGYDTLFVGKYLNGYGEGRGGQSYVPPGWTQWRGSVDPNTYNFMQPIINANGHVTHYHQYNTDLFADQVDGLLGQPERTRKPWYMWVNYVAPHFGGPWDADDPAVTHPNYPDVPKTTVPAPRHRNMFAHLNLPTKPNMFEADTSDKPANSPTHRHWDATGRQLVREEYQQRIEALQAVDEAVGEHLALLRRTGQLANTIIIFSSDNGYAVGEHNVGGKLWHYNEILQLPTTMRGPGIPHGKVVSTPVTNPDIPVSIAAAAGAHPGRTVDGVNIFGWLNQPTATRVIPIEAYPVRGGTHRIYAGVRVGGTWTYMRYANGLEEMYDLRADPYELTNVAYEPAYRTQRDRLRTLTRAYKDCSGSSCPTQFYR